MSLPRLALLSPQFPYPPLSGGTAHIMQAIRALAHSYSIDLHVLTSHKVALEVAPLSAICEAIYTHQHSPAPLWYPPIPAIRNDYSSSLVATLRDMRSSQHPDVIQLEFTSMAQYAQLARRTGALVVCTAHNVAFLAQMRRARQTSRGAHQLRRWAGALALWLYELNALRHCHLVVTHSEADAKALQRWLKTVPVVYIPSGIDLKQWPVCFNATAEDTVLFVGNYLHPPNVEGACWLAREVWPLARRLHPQARLILAGRTPPSAVQALAAPDIMVPGTVDDLHGLYAQASLAVAPIFWGSGVRIKLLEALASGVPVVTTAAAAEGIDLQHEHSALFAERADSFAAMIVRLLTSSELRAHIGMAGRAIIERDYDWQVIGQQLVARYAVAHAQLQHSRA